MAYWINASQCISCGKCARVCPVQCISPAEGQAADSGEGTGAPHGSDHSPDGHHGHHGHHGRHHHGGHGRHHGHHGTADPASGTAPAQEPEKPADPS